MRIRPDTLAILELARDTLREEYREESYEERRYETLMIVNAVNIATRQFEFGMTPETEEFQELSKLLSLSIPSKYNLRKELGGLLAKISQDIRCGKFDPGCPQHKNLLRILKSAAHQLVMEYNPRYLAGPNG